ncbi:MAG: hypothetical protein ABR520_02985 [Mycobacteriales bacterium]|nr:hypothetical protein [Frankia sp.]
MLRRALVVTALLAGSFAVAAPAHATECTPKGCSGGCRLANPNPSVDPENLTVTLDRPIECYG